MKKIFIFGVYTAFVLLSALVFSSCPVEDEIAANGTSIKLINVPDSVLGENKNFFLAVFADKDAIGPRGNTNLQPLTGHEPRGLQLGFMNDVRNGNTLLVPSFGESIVDGKEYVLVLGLSPSMDESTGYTYTTNDKGDGNLAIPGDGSPIAPVTLDIVKGVAEVDFAEKFKYTGSRDELLAHLGDNSW
jgi:hypothetical protein